jgi:hypothetical protein
VRLGPPPVRGAHKCEEVFSSVSASRCAEDCVHVEADLGAKRVRASPGEQGDADTDETGAQGGPRAGQSEE